MVILVWILISQSYAVDCVKTGLEPIKLSLIRHDLGAVTELRGNDFVVGPDGKSRRLKLGDHLYDDDTVRTETGGGTSTSN